MSTITNGGPAFPHAFETLNPDESGLHSGMSLRDYFAAKAMQGFFADPTIFSAVSRGPRGKDVELATAAYEMADAMLAAREAK